MPSKAIILTCQQCGCEFTRTEGYMRKPARGKYCSQSCSSKSRTGERNSVWKGGRKIDAGGYILRLRPNHPHARRSGYVLEHRLVIEESIGRYLTPDEIVHHVNRNKTDNRLENLQVMSEAEHILLHHPSSASFSACSSCHATDRRIEARGLCKRCYSKQWKKSRPHVQCASCEQMSHIEALGLCKRCYNAQYKALRPTA